MDWTGIVAVIGAVAAGIATVVASVSKFLTDRDTKRLASVDRRQQDDIDMLWEGLVRRGFVGARRIGFLTETDGRRAVAEKVRELFLEKRDDLKAIRKKLKNFLGRDPLDLELAFEIEKQHQVWLTKAICPALGVEQYECVALATVIACENGSKDHRPGSWPQPPTP